MPALVQVQGSAGTILFEGDFNASALEEIGIRDRIDDAISATVTASSSLAATIRNVAEEVAVSLIDLATEKREGGAFSQAVIELGVTVSGAGNVIVARGAADANLKITLTWDFS